jgi:RES domain-containing protein
MKVYRIGKCKYINDLSGYGSFLNAGRWHYEGMHILYSRTNPAIAMLECLVNFDSRRPPSNMCLVVLEIDEHLITSLQNPLPVNWDAYPSPQALQEIGSGFIAEKKFLGMEVPSAIAPLSKNILINPNHKDFNLIKIIETLPFEFDKRLNHKI